MVAVVVSDSFDLVNLAPFFLSNEFKEIVHVLDLIERTNLADEILSLDQIVFDLEFVGLTCLENRCNGGKRHKM